MFVTYLLYNIIIQFIRNPIAIPIQSTLFHTFFLNKFPSHHNKIHKSGSDQNIAL